jgi:uncharacterized C2H2 Zn-finger protein
MIALATPDPENTARCPRCGHVSPDAWSALTCPACGHCWSVEEAERRPKTRRPMVR